MGSELRVSEVSPAGGRSPLRVGSPGPACSGGCLASLGCGSCAPPPQRGWGCAVVPGSRSSGAVAFTKPENIWKKTPNLLKTGILRSLPITPVISLPFLEGKRGQRRK